MSICISFFLGLLWSLCQCFFSLVSLDPQKNRRIEIHRPTHFRLFVEKGVLDLVFEELKKPAIGLTVSTTPCVYLSGKKCLAFDQP